MTAGRPTSVSASLTRVCDFRRQLHDRVAAIVVQEFAVWILLVAQFALQRDALGHFQADLQHRLAEEFAVFGLVDGVGARADQFDVVLLQRAALAQGERGVERGLSAHGRQQREDFSGRNIRPFARDDLLDEFRRDRLDVGRVRHARIGHDRGRIRIDQHDAIALGPQRLAGLRTGIVELAGLADDDGSGADDQDGVDVGTLGHLVSRAHGRARGSASLGPEIAG